MHSCSENHWNFKHFFILFVADKTCQVILKHPLDCSADIQVGSDLVPYLDKEESHFLWDFANKEHFSG